MGWTRWNTDEKTLKAAFEDCSGILEWEVGLSKEYSPEMPEDLKFFIVDYRIKGGKLTLLIQNLKHPDHREIVCSLIELNKENGHFFNKQMGYTDGFVEKFPMMKTWAEQLLAKQGRCNTDNEWVRERFREFSRQLSDAYAKPFKSGGI